MLTVNTACVGPCIFKIPTTWAHAHIYAHIHAHDWTRTARGKMAMWLPNRCFNQSPTKKKEFGKLIPSRTFCFVSLRRASAFLSKVVEAPHRKSFLSPPRTPTNSRCCRRASSQADTSFWGVQPKSTDRVCWGGTFLSWVLVFPAEHWLSLLFVDINGVALVWASCYSRYTLSMTQPDQIDLQLNWSIVSQVITAANVHLPRFPYAKSDWFQLYAEHRPKHCPQRG